MDLSRQKSLAIDDTQLDRIISALETKLANRPGDARIVSNLLTLLDCQSPRITGGGPYSQCQRALSAHYHATVGSKDGLTLDTFRANYRSWKSILDKYKLNKNVAVTQIYEGSDIQINDTPASCGAFLNMFSKTGVIAGLCSGCFKVKILPSDVSSLVKLYFILKNMFFERDNLRKCLVEIRDKMEFPYKGYIFCQSEDEALFFLNRVKTELRIHGLSDVYCEISHGCLEYGLKYPDFHYSVDGKHRSFERPKSWQSTETEYLAANPLAGQRVLYYSNEAITLRDMMCIETWITYEETIGDHSYKKLLGNETINAGNNAFAKRIAQQAARRNAELEKLRARQSQ